MKGIILNPGLISADDGKRYTYDDAALKTPEISAAAGMAVDFIAGEDGKASEVYLLPNSSNKEQEFVKFAGISSLRTRAIVAIICNICSLLPGVGLVLLVVSLVLWILIFQQIKRETGISGFISLIISGVIYDLIAKLTILFSGVGAIMSGDPSLLAAAIVAIVFLLLSVICYAKVDFKLANATGINLFKICGYLRIASFLPAIGVFISIAAVVVEIVAWTKVSELKKH